MTTSVELTDTHLEIRSLVREFAQAEIAPHAAEWNEAHHVPVDVLPAEGATLVLRVDPRGWFLGTDFDEVKKAAGAGATPPYALADEPKGVSVGVFDNMRRNAGVYTLEVTR